MDPKTLYEASWKDQRLREADNIDKRNWFTNIRKAFTSDRYAVAAEMLEEFNLNTGGLIDIGCGRGEILSRVGAKFDRLVGVDISSTELALIGPALPETIRNKTTLSAIDLNSPWPFEDGEFDIVTALSVVEHLFDPYLISSELARICKRGGGILIEVPNIAYIKYRLSLLVGTFPSTSGDPVGWDGGHLHYFTINALNQLFSKVGCVPVAVKSAGFLNKVRNQWPALLGHDFTVLYRKM